MTRPLFAVVALALLAAPARADTLPLVLEAPGTYVPGTPFTFELRAPGVTDLGLYNVELVFQTSVLGPLGLSAAPAAGAASPFGTAENFASGSSGGPGLNEFRLTISDFTLGGRATTVAGVNDLLARVTVSPGVDLTGPIRVSVAPDSRLFDTSAGEPIPSDPPPTFAVEQAGAASPVPAPPAWALALVGGGLLVRRLARR